MASDQRRKGTIARARHSVNEDRMKRIDNSQRTAAKIAGVSGLLAVAIVVVGNYALLSPLVVPGNAAETARNIVFLFSLFSQASTKQLTRIGSIR